MHIVEVQIINTMEKYSQYANSMQSNEVLLQARGLESYLAAFIKEMNQSKTNFVWCFDEEKRINDLTQDYLHRLELQNLSYHEYAVIAEMLRQCRIDRRNVKDARILLEKLVLFLNSDEGKNFILQLQQIVESASKLRIVFENRKYHPRVLSNQEFGVEE